MDKSCHLSDSTSTTNRLNETCSLDTSGDDLLHLDSPSLSSELQDTSSVEQVEVEFFPEFEETLDNNIFDQQMLSVNDMTMTCSYSKKIDTPSDNLSHQDSHFCEKRDQDDICFIHTTNLSHNFALPQFMA